MAAGFLTPLLSFCLTGSDDRWLTAPVKAKKREYDGTTAPIYVHLKSTESLNLEEQQTFNLKATGSVFRSQAAVFAQLAKDMQVLHNEFKSQTSGCWKCRCNKREFTRNLNIILIPLNYLSYAVFAGMAVWSDDIKKAGDNPKTIAGILIGAAILVNAAYLWTYYEINTYDMNTEKLAGLIRRCEDYSYVFRQIAEKMDGRNRDLAMGKWKDLTADDLPKEFAEVVHFDRLNKYMGTKAHATLPADWGRHNADGLHHRRKSRMDLAEMRAQRLLDPSPRRSLMPPTQEAPSGFVFVPASETETQSAPASMEISLATLSGESQQKKQPTQLSEILEGLFNPIDVEHEEGLFKQAKMALRQLLDPEEGEKHRWTYQDLSRIAAYVSAIAKKCAPELIYPPVQHSISGPVLALSSPEDVKESAREPQSEHKESLAVSVATEDVTPHTAEQTPATPLASVTVSTQPQVQNDHAAQQLVEQQQGQQATVQNLSAGPMKLWRWLKGSS
jgi:hypothetical protein